MQFDQFGKYQLLRKIAVGGMAEIFLAKQGGLAGFEKLIVIKRILPEMAADEDFVKMFLDEARLAASMAHPNVAQVFDLDRVGSTIYIAMEYIQGQDLAQVGKACRRSGVSIPRPLLARILVGACEGLHYAHTLKDPRGTPLNLVHRDVTPSNILVAYEGATKILDFGVAKAESQMSKTAAGKLKGKFPFMAPEQIRMEKLDARVDVWSLGVVLWESLVGRRLFHADNELGVIKSILERPIPPPSAMAQVPAELDAVALNALQRNRDRRYPNAQAMQRELEAYLRTLTVSTTTLEVAAFMKQTFATEYAAHEKLLAEIPHASPEQLADLVSKAEPGKAEGVGSRSGTSGPSEPKSMPRRSRAGLWAGLGVGAAVLAAAAFLLLRPAAAVLGEVSVSSDPAGALLSLDGQQRPEKTPATLKGLALGTHELRATLEGRQPRSSTVELTRERPATAIALSLPEAVLEPGTLVVMTDPAGANVYLDGARQMPSPVTIPRVAARVEHAVLLEKDGFEMTTQQVTLEPGAKKELTVSLKAKPVPAAPGKRGKKDRTAAASAGGSGTLNLTVDPACDVFVDGKRLGNGSVSASVGAGDVSVQLVNKELGISQWTTVSVPSGGKADKKIVLGKGKIAADVQPWADVYIGDRKLGTTPLAPREVYEGSYLVRLVNSEIGAIKTVNVTVKPGQTAVIRQNLQP